MGVYIMSLPLPSLVLLLLLVPAAVHCQCTEGWQLHGDTCYLLSEHILNWFEAKEFCEQNDGHMAEFDNAEEIRQLYPLFTPYEFDFWVGLNDVAEEGTWVYNSGNVPTFNGWHQGEPNNSGVDGGMENCGLLGFIVGSEIFPFPSWYDMTCELSSIGIPGILSPGGFKALCQPGVHWHPPLTTQQTN